MKNIEKKYKELFISFDKGYMTEDEIYLYIYLGEGLIDKKEFDYWTNKLNQEKKKTLVNYPSIFRRFNRKYKAIIDHYKKGLCTSQEMLDAIEVIEKYDLFNLSIKKRLF